MKYTPFLIDCFQKCKMHTRSSVVVSCDTAIHYFARAKPLEAVFLKGEKQGAFYGQFTAGLHVAFSRFGKGYSRSGKTSSRPG